MKSLEKFDVTARSLNATEKNLHKSKTEIWKHILGWFGGFFFFFLCEKFVSQGNKLSSKPRLNSLQVKKGDL